jgi:hypothetical protein
MARKPPDLSSPQMKKPLGQVENSPSSCDGILRSINLTISMSAPAMIQSVTRMLGQMQETETSFNEIVNRTILVCRVFPHSGS